jgi:hypothetical protein
MTTTLIKVEYTHESGPLDSTAVDWAGYNTHTRDLFVDLHDQVYVYHNVPKDRYDRMVSADSVGREFVQIKHDFGPSDYLGHYADVEYEQVKVTQEAFESNVVTSASGFTPKGLTYGNGASVTDLSGNTSTYFTLNNTAPARSGNSLREFVVEFTSGSDKTHSRHVEADSFASAEADVLEIAEMLDLTFEIKEIRVVE